VSLEAPTATLTPATAPAPSLPDPASTISPSSPGVAVSTPASRVTTFSASRSSLRLPASRSRAVAFVLGSRILLAGGLTTSGTTDSIEILDPIADHATLAGLLNAPVHDAGGTTIDGVGFVFGGGRFGPGSLVQRVEPSGRTVMVGHLPAIRADLAAVTVGSEMIIVGGGTPGRPDDRVLATSDGRQFRVAAHLRVAVRYPAVVAVGQQVFVIGGATPSGDTRVIQVVDPVSGRVRIVGRLPLGLSHASALVIGGAVLLAGGRSAGRAQDGLWQLDPSGRAFLRVGRLPDSVSDAAAVVLHGTGYLIGGEARAPLDTVITIATE
jgi:hypothetical protein